MTYVDLPWEKHRPVQVQLVDGVWCGRLSQIYADAVHDGLVAKSPCSQRTSRGCGQPPS